MADQLNILASGQIVPTSLHTEVQRSYLEYAMSVIVGRALPDVRDGPEAGAPPHSLCHARTGVNLPRPPLP